MRCLSLRPTESKGVKWICLGFCCRYLYLGANTQLLLVVVDLLALLSRHLGMKGISYLLTNATTMTYYMLYQLSSNMRLQQSRVPQVADPAIHFTYQLSLVEWWHLNWR